MIRCGKEFHLHNNPAQWSADYEEFIKAMLDSVSVKPRHVALVGVSEGALPAVTVASRLRQVTHLAIIGDGGFSMRRALNELDRKGDFVAKVDEAWPRIAADSLSVDRKWIGHPSRYWHEIMDVDPLPLYLKLDIPILVGIGERDRSVPVESAMYLASEYRKAGKSNLTLMVYPGANHLLRTKGRSYRPEFFRALGELIRQDHRP